ncbi:hypothetical protein GCM10009676_27160 [Prauserella halophila]|uniref:LysE type translocator n=1 Tax=Prauserella halophila TaxID=185641 RepID=A0ABN1W9L3_9PSEU|nr:hypothetical protein [Prauserella halophila]MCP2235089.1 hypothetical protein [Prauserella halophila]
MRRSRAEAPAANTGWSASAAANPALQLLLLGVLLQVIGLAVALVTGQLAGAVRDRVLGSPRVRTVFERLAATVYGALAAALIADSAR